MWLVFHFRDGSRLFLQVTEVWLRGEGLAVRDVRGVQRSPIRLRDLDSMWICTTAGVVDKLHKVMTAAARRTGEQDDEASEEGEEDAREA